jgi:hypothetical protein
MTEFQNGDIDGANRHLLWQKYYYIIKYSRRSHVGMNIKHDIEEFPVYPVIHSISTASGIMSILKKKRKKERKLSP